MSKTKIEWKENLVDKFWGKVDKTEYCWVWKAGLFTNGYGQFRVGEKKVKAHRFSFVLTYGSIPPDKIICHKCDNKKCVNPEHLFLGTHKINAADRDKKGRGIYGRKIPKPSTAGSKNHASKLHESNIKEIVALRKSGLKYSTIADKYKVSVSAICQIIKLKKWQHVQR